MLNIRPTTAAQISQLFRQVSLILTSILLAKTGLNKSEIGIYETLMFIGTTLSFFWVNALGQSVTALHVPLENPSAKRLTTQFYGNIILLYVILSGLLFGLLTLTPQLILPFLTGRDDVPYLKLFALYLLLNLPPYFLESYWVKEEKPLPFMRFSFVSHFLFPLVVAVPLFLGYDLWWSLMGLVCLAALRFLIFFNCIKTIINPQDFDFQGLWSTFKFLMPLALYALMGGLTMAIAGWMVNWHYNGDLGKFAEFRFGAREFPIAVAMATGLSSAIIPQLRGGHHAGLTTLKAESTRLWHQLFPLTVLLMFLAKPLFPIIFNNDFAAAAAIFKVFLLILISRVLFPQSIIIARGERHVLLYGATIEVIAIVILSFILTPLYGLVGLSWAICLGYFIEKIYFVFYLKFKEKIDFQIYTNIKLYTLYSIALLIAYAVSQIEL